MTALRKRMLEDMRIRNFALSTQETYAEAYEKADTVLVRCEMPGVDEKDLEVTLEDNVLTVTGPQKPLIGITATPSSTRSAT